MCIGGIINAKRTARAQCTRSKMGWGWGCHKGSVGVLLDTWRGLETSGVDPELATELQLHLPSYSPHSLITSKHLFQVFIDYLR
jgi:hypothetical protein